MKRAANAGAAGFIRAFIGAPGSGPVERSFLQAPAVGSLAVKLRLKAAAVSNLARPLHQQHLFGGVDFMKLHFDNLAAAGGNMFADVGGLNGQFAMAAVDKHGQLHAARTAVVEERVERGADGAPGVKHIVADARRRGPPRRSRWLPA